MLNRVQQFLSMLLCAALICTSGMAEASTSMPGKSFAQDQSRISFSTQALAARVGASRSAPGPLSLGRRLRGLPPIGSATGRPRSPEEESTLASRVWQLLNSRGMDTSRLLWHKKERGIVDALRAKPPLSHGELMARFGITHNNLVHRLTAIEAYLEAFQAALSTYEPGKIESKPIMWIESFGRRNQDNLLRRGALSLSDISIVLMDGQLRKGLGSRLTQRLETLIAGFPGLALPDTYVSSRRNKARIPKKDQNEIQTREPRTDSKRAGAIPSLAQRVFELLEFLGPEAPPWLPEEAELLDAMNFRRTSPGQLMKSIARQPEAMLLLMGIRDKLEIHPRVLAEAA